MNLTKKGERACAYPGCARPVTDEDDCSGCGYFVCEVHCVNSGVMGRHDVTEH